MSVLCVLNLSHAIASVPVCPVSCRLKPTHCPIQLMTCPVAWLHPVSPRERSAHSCPSSWPWLSTDLFAQVPGASHTPFLGSHPSLSLFLAGNRSCWGSSVSRTKCCGSRRGWCSSSEQRRFVVGMVLHDAAATPSAPGMSAFGDKPHCKAMGMARKWRVLLSWRSSVGWGRCCAHVVVPCIHGPLRREKATSCTRMLTAAAPLVLLRRVWRVP